MYLISCVCWIRTNDLHIISVALYLWANTHCQVLSMVILGSKLLSDNLVAGEGFEPPNLQVMSLVS